LLDNFQSPCLQQITTHWDIETNQHQANDSTALSLTSRTNQTIDSKRATLTKLHKHVIGPATQSGSSQSQPHLPETSAYGLWLSIPGTPGYFSSLRPMAQPLSAMRHVARGEMEPRNSRWLLTLSERVILREGKRPRLLLHLHLFRGGHRRNGVFPLLSLSLLA
jgi:hypothetical protein